MKLAGFTSRWMMLERDAYSSAATACLMNHIASSTLKTRPAKIESSSVCPSMKPIAR